MAASMLKGVDLYALLGASKDVTTPELQKLFRRKAVQCHPDKAPEGKEEEYKEAFQRVGLAYALLKDPEKRKLYDTKGIVSDDVSLTEGVSVYDFVSRMYTVTLNSIEDFREQFRGSKMELKDLARFYKEFKGDFDKILDEILYDTMDPAEEDRLGDRVAGLIEAGELKETAAWKRTRPSAEKKKTKAYKDKWRQRKAEAKVADKEMAELLEERPHLAAASSADAHAGALALLYKQVLPEIMAKFGDKLDKDKVTHPDDDPDFDRRVEEYKAKQEAAAAGAKKGRKRGSGAAPAAAAAAPAPAKRARKAK
eukprot:TRINITY_DN2441_c1_g2_i1.p1 TRINITY_DN2441_c1_g2~~TRINITY_DN2441_c1_g2_i1.p1  ORF type:complete len:339 (+),score=172.18 TRINITY_DN2441_c1_g2_i1:89-1018(+)